jgi:hypothetical protein
MQLGMVTPACDSSTWQAVAGGLQVQGQIGPYKTLFQKLNK